MRRTIFIQAILSILSLATILAKDEPVLVTCGSFVKLEHVKTGHLLHSQDVAYGMGRGSGQQGVTGYPDRDSSSSLWIVRGVGDHCVQGNPVKNGAQIRLQHAVTQRWLHSHHFSSPLSNNQEVSCFGSNEESDSGDVWVIEWDDKSKEWERDASIKLKHQDTGAFLASHEIKYQRPLPGHTEVFGSKKGNYLTQWKAVEGIYYPNERTDDQ